MKDGHFRLPEWVIAAPVFIALFAGISYLAQTHQARIEGIIGAGGFVGPAAYILLMIVFVVFVIPLDLVLLVPIGAALWGAILTALLSIAGWTLGAGIAFFLARRFGKPFIARIVGEKRLAYLERRVPIGNEFWSVVLLRMSVPVDILSYALGLFGTISAGRYLLATAIGVAPFAFFFAYAGTLPLWYQIGALAIAGAVATVALWRGSRRE